MNVLVVGSQGHAASVIDVVEKEGKYRIVGLLDRFRAPGEEAHGYRVLGPEEDLQELAAAHAVNGVIIAVGDNWQRARISRLVSGMVSGLVFPVVMHPSAVIGRQVTFGQGTVVMAGAVINAESKIGRFCIINTSASVDHECVLGDFSSVAPGATLGGGITVGEYSAVCLGARVIQGRKIGTNAVIGASATVLQDIRENAVAYGTPARVIRLRKNDEPYL